jgi:glycosyltransferase involved in cell wall biosynthesis
MIVVHVTHEAVEKIGGIGAVVAGLVTAEKYAENVSRTILVGPLLNTDRPGEQRLGPDGEVIYSRPDDIVPSPWRERFSAIEKTYDVGLIYGKRKVAEPCSGRNVEVEVLLVDVFHANESRLNLFKGELFSKFAVPSHDFQDTWEYEQYVRLAEPAFEALKAVGARDDQILLLAHEYMGMPTALKAILDGSPKIKTVFYAHEVASVRPIVEKHPGHDTMFYNAMDQAKQQGRYLEDVFPEVRSNFKHPLVKAARYCDHIFAVGDFVVEELRFLDHHFHRTDIDLVYNGIPTMELTFEQRQESRRRMATYAEHLTGWRPEWVFTHVARPVLSKGIWRDLRVLHEMEPLLKQRNERAVYFMLGTLGGQRRPQDVRQMERVYGWPGAHEKGYPDLCGGEEVIGDMFDAFNREHEAARVVLVNQWDWSRQWCGERMPEDMTFQDIRAGTDLEFGLSVYEPYGISQFEGLSFGALCVVSNVCGCMGFARKAMAEGGEYEHVVEGNFLELPRSMNVEQIKDLSMADRDLVESREGRRLAEKIIEALPRDEQAVRRRIKQGWELASRMSWEQVMEQYFLPSLGRAAAH